MKRGLLGLLGLVGLISLLTAAALATAGTAAAGGKTLRISLSGRCTATDKLDANGALLSTTIVCNASAACSCAGSTKLTYTTTSVQAGNGNPGPEHGSFVASGPTGSATLEFKGSRSALGAGKGTWTLGTVKGFKGVRLLRRGTYNVTTKTLSSVVGSRSTVVRVTATLSPWVSGT
jgi:hypothetical protein